MKKKVVIKVSMCGGSKKTRTKALKIAAGVSGVESAAWEGADMDQLAVTGEGIDAVCLTKLLRKKLQGGQADLLTVGPVKQQPTPTDQPVVPPPIPPSSPPSCASILGVDIFPCPHSCVCIHCVGICYDFPTSDPPFCSIM